MVTTLSRHYSDRVRLQLRVRLVHVRRTCPSPTTQRDRQRPSEPLGPGSGFSPRIPVPRQTPGEIRQTESLDTVLSLESLRRGLTRRSWRVGPRRTTTTRHRLLHEPSHLRIPGPTPEGGPPGRFWNGFRSGGVRRLILSLGDLRAIKSLHTFIQPLIVLCLSKFP